MAGVLTNWFTDNLALVALALGIAVVIILLLVITLLFRLRKLARVHKSLMTGTEGVNLEQLLESYLAKVQTAEKKVSELNQRSAKLEEYAQKSLQNVALLRFNAFEKMGSDLSFAAALLDQKGDGLVLSSINSREESRVYAKPIQNGQSSYHLSQEEIEAIRNAIETGTTKR